MLAFAEKYLARIHRARQDTEIIALIGSLATEFGFRSGYLVSYGANLETEIMVLDSNWARVGWWEDYVATGTRDKARVLEIFAKGGIQHLQAQRVHDRRDPAFDFASKIDMVDVTVLPISLDQDICGLVGLCGEQALSLEQERTLILIGYSLFAKAQSLHATGVRVASAGLTPREREVMVLSAEGLTSKEIADRLDMSPRTANQHLDNVADKLGTKNRVHTVAEAIRKSLL